MRPESLVLATDVPDDVKMQEREEEEEFEESEEEEDELEDACGVDAAPASEAPNASPLQPSVFWCYGCSES